LKTGRRRGTSFRARLTLAFVLVTAVSAGSLAVASFLLVQKDRFDSLRERSIDKTRLALAIAEERLSDPPTSEQVEDLMLTLRRRAGIEAMAVTSQDEISVSSEALSGAEVPEEVLDASVDDGLQMITTNVAGHSYLVFHPTEPDEPTIFFLFSTENLLAQMSRFAGVLWRVWLVVVVAAAILGQFIARRTLKPVARAGETASALAEGRLEARIPTGRRDEFGSWAESFNRMAAALQEKIHQLEEIAERERRFTSDVAHELRTPLSALVTSVAMLAEAKEQMGPDARWAAERLAMQVKRLRRLIEELLEISRLDAGREAVNLTRTSLNDMITRLIAHHGWRSQIDIDADDAVIRTDLRRMDRIVGNLVSNAIEHGGGTAKVVARAGPDEMVIEVHDRGPGIPPEELSRIFNRFYKSDPARGGGSGLGLAIALENALLLGGDLTVAASEHGSVFRARFPLLADEEASLREPQDQGGEAAEL